MIPERVTLVFVGLILATTTACSPNQNPDQIRERTARDAEAIKQDGKAVAEGLKDGLSGKHSVDLNRASKEDLVALPGMTDRKAERIIEERPYADAHQLVTRQVLTEAEYAQIRDRVTVSR